MPVGYGHSASSVRPGSPTAACCGAAASCACTRLCLDPRLPTLGRAALHVGKRPMGSPAPAGCIVGSRALASKSSWMVLGTGPLASLSLLGCCQQGGKLNWAKACPQEAKKCKLPYFANYRFMPTSDLHVLRQTHYNACLCCLFRAGSRTGTALGAAGVTDALPGARTNSSFKGTKLSSAAC